ncbi:MAG TPA: hypothetical protein VFI78_08070 [Salinimicrobium sp.]|nr:hypothetical protein [Salinimicrobium sp.]
MKKSIILGIGVIAVIIIAFLILFKILELALGAIFILVAIILIGWLYFKVKDKLE